MSDALIPFQDVERMAMAVAKSGLFGVKTPEQAISLMLVAQAEGLHPMAAAMTYDVIQGRPSKKSKAILASFLAAGGSVEWHQMDDVKADATFSHPQGGKLRISWDMARAAKAGLAGRDMWLKYPRRMLFARVVSEGISSIYPAATGGMYTPEEVGDMVPLTATPVTVSDGTGSRMERIVEAAVMTPADIEAKVAEITAKVDAAPSVAAPTAKPEKSPEEARLFGLRRGMFAHLAEHGLTKDDLKAHLKQAYGLDSTKDFKEHDIETVKKWISANSKKPMVMDEAEVAPSEVPHI